MSVKTTQIRCYQRRKSRPTAKSYRENGLGNGCRLFFNILVYLSWPGCGSCSHMEPPRPARSLGPGRESGSAPPTAAALSTSHTHTTKYNYCQQQTFLLSQKVRFCESCEFSKRKDYSALLWSVCFGYAAFAECDLSVCVYRVYTWKLGLAEVVPSDERLHARACEQERHDRDEREPTAMQSNVT